MPDRNVARKRRPVDVLFGDRSAAYPDYVIEAPQPVTTVSPPPPELTLIVEPAPVLPPAVAPIEKTQPDLAPVAVPPPLPADKPRSEPEPEPILASKTVATQDRISQLYDEVRIQLGDTPGVAKECMELLLEARIAYGEGDFATAEFYTESVDARLTQCALSQQSSRRPIVWIISLWNLGVLVAAGVTLVGTYALTLTRFGVAVDPEALLLIRTVAWGVIGAVLGVMINLVWSISHREYDPGNDLGYFAKAVVGAEFGGVFFILFQSVVVVGNLAAGVVQLIHVFMYLLAMLVAFGQDAITEFVSSLRT